MKQWLKENWIVVIIAIAIIMISVMVGSLLIYLQKEGLQVLWYGTGD